MGDLTARQFELMALARQRQEQDRATHQAPTPEMKGSIIEQIGIGTNEGLSGMAGLPVDAATWALNKGAAGLERITGAELGRIESPVGGSESILNALSPFVSDAKPQTPAQELSRRVGQEIGAGVIPGGAIARATRLPGRALAINTASDVAAGIGGGVAEQVAPDSQNAQMVASILAGGATAGALSSLSPITKGPSMAALRDAQSEAYKVVEESGVRLTPNATETISARIRRRMTEENMDPILHPKSDRMMGILEESAGSSPTISSFENTRRAIGRDVAGALDPAERRLGSAMVDEIDEYLSNLRPRDTVGANADDVVESLLDARNLTGRIKRSELLDSATDRASRQASVAGTGGNVINTTRQRINAILNNPKQLRGFSDDDIQAMRDIVSGTPTQNAARLLGRMSPTSGALPLMGGFGAAATGIPGLQALPLIGYGAKTAGEVLTDRAVTRLSEQLRSGVKLPPPTGPAGSITSALAIQQGLRNDN